MAWEAFYYGGVPSPGHKEALPHQILFDVFPYDRAESAIGKTLKNRPVSKSSRAEL